MKQNWFHFYPTSVRNIPQIEMAVEKKIFAFRGVAHRASHINPFASTC